MWMIKIAVYSLMTLAILTIARGFWTGKMDGNTTLYEVGSAMKDYRIQIAEGITGIAKKK